MDVSGLKEEDILWEEDMQAEAECCFETTSPVMHMAATLTHTAFLNMAAD